MKLHVNDLVQVRTREEILATLDENGRLDGLPFMPQMLKYCGQHFRVRSSAYKTCDTVSGHYVGLQSPDTVHLDLRCDGEAYGGCQAGCLIFWKNAWLKPIEDAAGKKCAPGAVRARTGSRVGKRPCTDADVWAAATRKGADRETRYACQATELLEYAAPLKWWDARQYVEAYTSGNRSLLEVFRGLFYLFYYYSTLAFSDRWGKPSRWLYNRVQALAGGVPFPRLKGKIPLGVLTPRHDLHLRPGEFVRVKSYDEILSTLDTKLSNRGLSFDAELVPFCGKVFRVSTCVERFVDEKTGKMRRMKTPAVILEGVTCGALYSGRRLFCPRSIHLWWREIWLEKISSGVHAEATAPAEARTCAFADKGAFVKS